ncbi:MAG: glycerol-3-phosphate 1-O-acyltransferase PlsY [Rhizobiaceae bacterium]
MTDPGFFSATGLLALATGYLSGSIPFGLLIALAGGKGDVRDIGSGNIGATNVLRTGSRVLAVLTLVCDVLKGTVPVLVFLWWYGVPEAVVAGFGAFLGHLFPVWLKFKGGKGVATYLGVLIGLAWQGALVFGAIWLGVAAATRYSSLAALVAVVAVPLSLFYMGHGIVAWLFVILGVVVYLKHRANIMRLLAGSESRIGAKG